MAEKLKPADTPLPRSEEEIRGDFAEWEKELADTAETPQEGAGTTGETLEATPDISDAVAAKAELAALPDAEIRYRDADMLNKRGKVLSTLNNAVGKNRLRKMRDYVSAKFNNLRDSPGLFKREMALAFHEARYQRYSQKMERLEGLPEAWKQHHIDKFNRLKTSYDTSKRRFDAYNDRMQDRVTSVHENAAERKDAYTKYLIDKKADALARKVARTELRESGMKRGEAKEIAKNIPAEHLQRVAGLAITAEAYRRKEARESRTAGKNEATESQLAIKYARNNDSINQYEGEALVADNRAKEIEGTELPKAKESRDALRKQLGRLDEKDPAYPGLEAQADEAQRTVDALTREQARQTQAAEHARQQITKLNDEQTQLAETLERAKQATAAAAAARTEHSNNHSTYSDKSKEAFGELLDSKKAAEANPESASASTSPASTPKPITPQADLKPFPVPSKEETKSASLAEYIATGTQDLKNYVNNPDNGTGEKPADTPATSPEQRDDSAELSPTEVKLYRALVLDRQVTQAYNKAAAEVTVTRKIYESLMNDPKYANSGMNEKAEAYLEYQTALEARTQADKRVTEARNSLKAIEQIMKDEPRTQESGTESQSNETAPATSPEQQEPSESAYSDKQNQLISIYEESRLAKQESETLYNDLKESKMLLAEAVMRDAPANVVNMLKREANAKNDTYEVAKEKLGEIYKRQADLVDELDAEGQLDAVNALYDDNGNRIDNKETKK